MYKVSIPLENKEFLTSKPISYWEELYVVKNGLEGYTLTPILHGGEILSWATAIGGFFGLGFGGNNGKGDWAGAGIGLGTFLLTRLLLGNIDTEIETPENSPTYNLRNNNNIARIGELIPIQYGRLRITPDLASDSYLEFKGQTEILNLLFMIGHGNYTINDIFLNNTNVNMLPPIQTQIIQAGSTLENFEDFSDNVETSEVENVSLFNPTTNQIGTDRNVVFVEESSTIGRISVEEISDDTKFINIRRDIRVGDVIYIRNSTYNTVSSPVA